MANNLTIISNKDRPLAIRIDDPTQLDRMLRDVEVPYVQAFLNYLSENSFEVYAGGSLIEHTLFGGREPSDIDLLAVKDKVAFLPKLVNKVVGRIKPISKLEID